MATTEAHLIDKYYQICYKESIRDIEIRKIPAGEIELTDDTKIAKIQDFSELKYKIRTGLVELRKSRKITQQGLAHMLNTKQTVISRIENGASLPSLRYMKRIAEKLGAEVDITFQPRNNQEGSSNYSSNNSIEYICVDCLYRWESKLRRSVTQCPQCHKRQGVMFAEYSKALHACKNIRLQVKKSPPFKKLPPVKSARNNIPDIFRVICETARSTFPSPKLPISLLFRIIEQSTLEQIEDQPWDTDRSANSKKLEGGFPLALPQG